MVCREKSSTGSPVKTIGYLVVEVANYHEPNTIKEANS